MIRARHIVAALLLAVLALPAHAITVKASLSFDASWSTLYRAGDKPQGGGDTCISGWTCAALGTATAQFDDLSATSIQITATSTGGDEGGNGAMRKAFGSEANRHFEARVVSIAGNAGDYTGAGIGIADGTTFASDYKSHCWLPQIGNARFKSDVGQAGELGQIGLTGKTEPYYLGVEYQASSNTMTCWESANGTDWTQVGTGIVHAFNTGIYYFWAASANGTSSATIVLDHIVESTTLSFVDEPPPPAADYIVEYKFENADWASDLGWGAGTSPTLDPNSGNSANNLTRQCGTANGISPTDNCWLRFEIDSGSHYGSAASIFLSEVGDDPGYGDTRYVSFDLRFGTDFTQSQNGKLPGFADQGGSCSAGGCFPVTGFAGWSARNKWIDQPCAAPNAARKGFNGYVYYAEQPTQYGQDVFTGGCTASFAPGTDRWSKVCQKVTMNSAPTGGTPKPKNGSVTLYIDNVQRAALTGIGLDWSGNYQIERVWMNVYHGGGQNAPQLMHLGIDNVRVSDQPVPGYCGI